jgi:hypothetical protein
VPSILEGLREACGGRLCQNPTWLIHHHHCSSELVQMCLSQTSLLGVYEYCTWKVEVRVPIIVNGSGVIQQSPHCGYKRSVYMYAGGQGT